MSVVDVAALALNSCVFALGPLRFKRLLDVFGDARAVLGASASRIAQIQGFDLAVAEATLRAARAFDGAKELDGLAALGARVIRWDSPNYPARLAACPAPPPLLYVWGDLPGDNPAPVAVVGTRQATDYGRAQAARFAEGIARAGHPVVSGLALGIDTVAHLATLKAGGRTVAVLGCGLRDIYPSQNKELARRIAHEGGAVISQFSLDTAPQRRFFPMRNATLAGLCAGVLVVEGEEDSGSLITAGHAADLGRDVYAVPGPADAPFSQGPLRLIQEGAKLVRQVEDVLEELPDWDQIRVKRMRQVSGTQIPLLDLKPRPKAAAPTALSEPAGLSPAQSAVWQVLRRGESGMDALALASGLGAGALGATLTSLEIQGVTRRLTGARVALAG